MAAVGDLGGLFCEWAPKGVRVNVACPGHTETPLTASLQDPEIRRGRSEVTPLRRVAQPIDVAGRRGSEWAFFG